MADTAGSRSNAALEILMWIVYACWKEMSMEFLGKFCELSAGQSKNGELHPESAHISYISAQKPLFGFLWQSQADRSKAIMHSICQNHQIFLIFYR